MRDDGILVNGANGPELNQELLDEFDPVGIFMDDVSRYPMIDHRKEIELARTIEGHKAVVVFRSGFSLNNNREPTGKEITLWLVDRVLAHERLIRALAVQNGLSDTMTLAQILLSYRFHSTLDQPPRSLAGHDAERLRSLCGWVKPLPLWEVDRVAGRAPGSDLRDLRNDSKFLRHLERTSEALDAHFARVVAEHREAHHQFTQANLRLVVSFATHYAGRGLPLLDLIQEGYIGLHRAVDGWNHRLGSRFSTYAVHWIRQSVTRSIADKARTIRLPVHLIESINKVAAKRRLLAEDLCRDPTPDELGEFMGLSGDRVKKITHVSHMPVSLESLADAGEAAYVAGPIERASLLSLTEGSDVQHFRRRLESLISVDEDGYAEYMFEDIEAQAIIDEVESRLLRQQIDSVLEDLTDREQKVLRLRFGLGRGISNTLEQVGRELNVTRERIRQIEGKALLKLRHPSRSRRLKSFLSCL